MLVLSRKIGEGFRLGDNIRVTVVKSDRNSVRIGIEAPGHISVSREEIVEVEEEDVDDSRTDSRLSNAF